MCSMDPFTVLDLDDYQNIKNELTWRWLSLEKIPNIFRYKLNVRQQKILDGRFGFFVQLNTERTILRRPPQSITSLLPEFDRMKFNFNSVKPNEILFECIDQTQSHSKQLIIHFLINNSPLTPYHCLICPNLLENRPQVLTKEAIQGACNILFGFADTNYHIGFNSPGAFASVNHLHLHLLYIETPLSIQNYNIHHLVENVYAIDESYPAHAYCFQITNADEMERVVDNVYRLIEYFRAKIVPHNLFWTFGSFDDRQIVKIFIFPRMRINDKMSASLNVAFCELSGYVISGSEEEYDALTEDKIVTEISNVVGDTRSLDDAIIHLFSPKCSSN